MNGRGLKIVLAVSLVLNLFVIGAVVGGLVVRQQLLARAVREDPVMSAANALAPAERDAFRAVMGPTLQSLRPALRDARLARREAVARLQAEPFDRAGAAADLARARADDAAARGQVEGAVLDFAATLPASDRAAFAKGLGRAALARWLASHPGRSAPAPVR